MCKSNIKKLEKMCFGVKHAIMIADFKSSKRHIFMRFSIKIGELAYLKSLFYKKENYYTFILDAQKSAC